MSEIKVLVNAGHRVGIDSGGVSKTGQTEAKTNLNVAIRVAEGLRKLGYTVVCTHELDDVKLMKASAVSKWAKGKFDYSISIHQNDAESESANGSETLHNGKDSVALAIAESVQHELAKLGGANRGTKTRTDLAMLNIKGTHCILTEGAFMTDADVHRIDTFKEQWLQADAIVVGFHNVVKNSKK